MDLNHHAKFERKPTMMCLVGLRSNEGFRCEWKVFGELNPPYNGKLSWTVAR